MEARLMKDYQKPTPTRAESDATSHHKSAYVPPTGATKRHWQGTRIDALSSRKLRSILSQLEHHAVAPDPEAETAIMDELLMRGNHSHRSQWRAPH